jgi:hypothetical protein
MTGAVIGSLLIDARRAHDAILHGMRPAIHRRALHFGSTSTRAPTDCGGKTCGMLPSYTSLVGRRARALLDAARALRYGVAD